MKDGQLSAALPLGTPRYVVAVSDAGERVELTGRVGAEGRLDWSAPGSFRVYAAVSQGPIQKVKRAAPGGEGNVVDPFSVASLGRYLRRFDEAFAGFGAGAPRSHFHDSYEYYGATFTPRVFEEFEARRGYDLRVQIEALVGDGDPDTVARVRSDYRATLGELHLDYVRHWVAWAHERGSLARNQAHGAPGDLVDLYAAADIPETEVFRKMDEAMIARLKLASSAAHVTGRKLASAEAFTWLGEHFQTPLSLVKRAADWLYLSGVNHLLFHGIPYSPLGEAWPGYQFYASVNFGPEGGLWRDLPALNAYLTRVQSILQSGDPDVDLLLYYSPHDAWQEPNPPSKPDDLAPQNPVPPAFEELGLRLWRRGYAWDAVSEARLADARVDGGRLRLGSGAYRAVVVPRTRLLSPARRAPARGPRARRRECRVRRRPSQRRSRLRRARDPAPGAARGARRPRGERPRPSGRRRRAAADAPRRPARGDDGCRAAVRPAPPRGGTRLLRREPERDGLRRLAAARVPREGGGSARPAGLGSRRDGERARGRRGPGRGPPAARARRVARRADLRSGSRRRTALALCRDLWVARARLGLVVRDLRRGRPGPARSDRDEEPRLVDDARRARTRSVSRAPRATACASSGRPQRPPTGSSTSATCARAHGSR